VLIKRLGGPGDHGIDIAGFLTEQSLAGEWDCYQCKHYSKTLDPTDAWIEMLKVFRSVLAKHYVMPRRYWFVAPRGAGLTLDLHLSNPEVLESEFLQWLTTNKKALAETTASEREEILALAANTDFSKFQAMPPVAIIQLHSRTKYHSLRFAVPIPPRNGVAVPPDELTAHEARYVNQLLAVYIERHGDERLTREGLRTDPRTSKHFGRQRQAFYAAESLRLHARDSVPEGTFARLQDDLLAGVIETADQDYPSGFHRMQNVLSVSMQLDLTRHALIQIANNDDRKGVCHQLVNDSRLTWLDNGKQ
jgi:hypothetical protein